MEYAALHSGVVLYVLTVTASQVLLRMFKLVMLFSEHLHGTVCFAINAAYAEMPF